MAEAIEDGRSAWYASVFRQDPSYKDWRVEICEYDLDEEGEPVNIRIVGSEPIKSVD